jgi:hypothetical protein
MEGGAAGGASGDDVPPNADGRGEPNAAKRLLGDVQRIALPLLISGGGFLGFVGFAGGVMTWARLSAADLPADQAIGAMSDGELITSGGVSLTLFALMGLLAVLTTYLIADEGKGTPNKGMLYGLLTLVAAESGVVLFLARHSDGRTAFAESIALLVVAGAAAVATIETCSAKDQEDPEEPFKLKPVGRVLGTLVALALGVVGGLVTHEYWAGLALPLAAFLGLVALRVAHRGRRFAWFGVAVFFSVAFFGAVVGTLHSLAEPQVQPMALIRKGDGATEGLQGIFIAENDERVYMASVQRTGCGKKTLRSDSGRLFWVPRDQVVTYAVGPPQNVERAANAVPEMLQDLVSTRVPSVADTKEKSTRPAALKPGAATSTSSGHTDSSSESAREQKGKPSLLVKTSAIRTPRPITVAPAIRAQPRIISIKPSTARPDERVIVKGKSFGPRATVSIGPVAAKVISWEQHAVAADKDKAKGTPKRKRLDKIVLKVPPNATTNKVVLSCPRKSNRRVLTVAPR